MQQSTCCIGTHKSVYNRGKRYSEKNRKLFSFSFCSVSAFHCNESGILISEHICIGLLSYVFGVNIVIESLDSPISVHDSRCILQKVKLSTTKYADTLLFISIFFSSQKFHHLTVVGAC